MNQVLMVLTSILDILLPNLKIQKSKVLEYLSKSSLLKMD